MRSGDGGSRFSSPALLPVVEEDQGRQGALAWPYKEAGLGNTSVVPTLRDPQGTAEFEVTMVVA